VSKYKYLKILQLDIGTDQGFIIACHHPKRLHNTTFYRFQTMAFTPVIQVLSKNNYEDQYLVSLPNAYPLPPLGPSSIRIKSNILSLTTNNCSYARDGHLLGWWDVHPLPPSIPAQYSDPTKFGRISAWGYAEVIESNVSGLQIGTQFYGYLPIGTLPLDMEVKLNNVPGQFLEVSKYREKQLPIYNRYFFYPPTSKEIEDKESLGYDSLMLVLFQTGYMINRYVFAWEPSELVQPSGDLRDGWTVQHGALGEKSIVLVFSASGKTALGLAYCLKHGRPAGEKPRMVIGIGSNKSKPFTEGTGLYDKVLTYDADSGDLGQHLGLKPDNKIAVIDFGSRDAAGDRWAVKLRKTYNDVVQLQVAGEFKTQTPEEATAGLLARMKKVEGYKALINACALRTQAMDKTGERKYYEDFMKVWDSVEKGGYINGMRLVWGEGMEDLGRGWEKLSKGEASPDEGLVFSLVENPTGKL
jgi:hypothetical protein